MLGRHPNIAVEIPQLFIKNIGAVFFTMLFSDANDDVCS